MKSALGDAPTRQEVLKFLFDSSDYGNLGLFVGAGFSKAVVDAPPRTIALSWGELLLKASKEMRVSLTRLKHEGSGYPDLASKLCEAHAKRIGVKPSQSLSKLKRIICAETAWYPPEDKRLQFASYLEKVAPSWIITTNYDQILECLLPGASLSLKPKDTFTSRTGLVPIFHLHGIRTDPESLIISQEDYVSLFRPNEYRQIRLALALKESTTCLLGYGLGDVNVLTALDWSSKVFQGEEQNYPREVIQVVRNTQSPQDAPYRLENGIVVIETPEISDFFEEFVTAIPRWKTQRSRRQTKIKKVLAIFRSGDPTDVTDFLEDGEWRKGILAALPRYEIEFVREFELFLNKVVDHNRKLSSRNGAFRDYAKGLDMSLDVLNSFECGHFPPALLAAIARNMDRLARYIGDGLGNSYSASQLWAERKSELSKRMIVELRAIAQCNRHASLALLLDDL